MEIKLLCHAPIGLLVLAVRTCYNSMDKSDSHMEEYDGWHYVLGDKDKALIKRIIDSGHHSTLEHLVFTFHIKQFSRAVLQELSRHRISVSPSVKSTRYTIKELKNEQAFAYDTEALERASKYLVFTGEDLIDISSLAALENARRMVVAGYPNDKVKYCLPESYKTEGIYTFNARSLRHLLELRTSPRALAEFQELANKLYDKIPEDFKFIFEDCVSKEVVNE